MAPLIAAVGLGIIAVLIMLNFDAQMIESEGFSALVIIIPGVIVGSGIVGLIWETTCG